MHIEHSGEALWNWHAYGFKVVQQVKTSEVSAIVSPPDIDHEFASLQKFVRVTRRRSNGFVEFQFSIHYQGMFVELILPAHAFEEFCMHNRVTLLEPL